MESNICTNICRFCLQTSDSNLETIEEVTFANLDFLLLKLNLSISEKPVMCGDCMKTIKTSRDFKTKCLEIENCIVSFVNYTDSIIVDLREVYLNKIVENVVNVPEDHINCRLCLELVKNDSAIFSRNRKDIVQKLEQYFPELDLTRTEDPVICTCCQVYLQHYFSFLNNCLTTERKILEYCKVEGTNSKGQIDLNSVVHFISKDFLKCKVEVEVKIEGMCNEISESSSGEIKKEILHVELDIKEDSSSQESELTDENSSQGHPSPSQSDCIQQLTRGKSAKYTCEICGYENNRRDRLQKHILTHRRAVQEYSCEICSFKTKAKQYLSKHMVVHKDASEVTIYRCAMCSYQTKRKYYLQQHMRIHMDKSKVEILKCPLGTTYKCDLCDFKTERKPNLRRHMVIHKTHLETTMYKCVTCSYETKYRVCLQQHRLIHISIGD